MADIISAEQGALRQGAAAVREAKSGIDQQTAKVRGEIESLRGYWSGAAAAAFTGLMNRWDEQVRTLNNVLITLEDALAGTERDQAATEQSHQDTIAGMASMMNES